MLVPTVFIVDGPAVSGPALLLGIADHVVMTEGAYAEWLRANSRRATRARPV